MRSEIGVRRVGTVPEFLEIGPDTNQSKFLTNKKFNICDHENVI